MLGVDISGSSVKIVEIGGTVDAPILKAAVIEPIEAGAVSDGNIERNEVVIDALRRALAKWPTKTRRAAIAMPASSVIAKRISLPAMLREEEVATQAESEANQYIPFAIDDIALDQAMLGLSASDPDSQDVLLVATRREQMITRQAICEQAGLKVSIVDAEHYAIERATHRVLRVKYPQRHESVTLMIKIGGSSSLMIGMRGDDELYTRDVSFGARALTEALAREYNLSLEEAEMKRRKNDLPDDSIERVVDPFRTKLCADLVRTVATQQKATSFPRSDLILLSGGGSLMMGLVEDLRDSAETPCDLLNPFDGMSVERGVRELLLRSQAPSFVTATGLALRVFSQEHSA